MKHTTNAVVTEKPTQHLWFWQRQTRRRKPGEPTATVVFRPYGYMAGPKLGSPARNIRKIEAKIALVEGKIRDEEIGINPIYLGGGARVDRGSPAHKAWEKRHKEWLKGRAKLKQAEAA